MYFTETKLVANIGGFVCVLNPVILPEWMGTGHTDDINSVTLVSLTERSYYPQQCFSSKTFPREVNSWGIEVNQ